MADWRKTLDAFAGALPEDSPGVVAATEEFEGALGQAEDEEVDAGEPKASWLLGLGLPSQVALLVAALSVLDRLGDLVSTLTDEEVPAEIRAGAQLMLAVAAFLAMAIEKRSGPPDSGDD